jgi:hypothetical protein
MHTLVALRRGRRRVGVGGHEPPQEPAPGRRRTAARPWRLPTAVAPSAVGERRTRWACRHPWRWSSPIGLLR